VRGVKLVYVTYLLVILLGITYAFVLAATGR
jgi:hypothetical protein